MAARSDFWQRVAPLNEVLQLYHSIREASRGSAEYDAELATYQLMEAVYQNIRAVETAAMKPEPGSHEAPVGVLLRAALRGRSACLLAIQQG